MPRRSTLLLGDQPIATLEDVGHDMPWIYGTFSPLPSFETIAPLFRLLQEALDAEAGTGDLYWDLLEHVNRLPLAVKHPNGMIERVEDFKLEDDQFEYKPAPSSLTPEVTVVLGAQDDAQTRDRLRSLVGSLGGSITERSYAVAGSQEVIVYSIVIPEGTLEAVAETFMGLSLRGPAALVDKIELALREGHATTRSDRSGTATIE